MFFPRQVLSAQVSRDAQEFQLYGLLPTIPEPQAGILKPAYPGVNMQKTGAKWIL
jgi:hypothetical protein